MLKKIAPLKNFAGLISVKTVPKPKSATDKQIVIEELKEREILKVQGADAVPFLQGLITNDMNQLISGRISGHGFPSMYAMFLNKFGRMLYDTVIYRTHDPSMFLLECDKQISPELRRHLQIYCVRRSVDIESMEKSYKPWVVFEPETIGNNNLTAKKVGEESIYTEDPRVKGLGWRLLTAPERSFGDVARAFAVPGKIGVSAATKDNNYRYHLYHYGIGEGVRDFPPGKCLPLEINGDYLNGVSLDKGCYIGQELTSRVFHTGAVRKRLLPLKLTASVDNATVVKTELGANVGTIRGVCNDRALALLRIEQVFKASKLTIDGEVCYVGKPKWWPSELPTKACVAGRV